MFFTCKDQAKHIQRFRSSKSYTQRLPAYNQKNSSLQAWHQCLRILLLLSSYGWRLQTLSTWVRGGHVSSEVLGKLLDIGEKFFDWWLDSRHLLVAPRLPGDAFREMMPTYCSWCSSFSEISSLLRYHLPLGYIASAHFLFPLWHCAGGMCLVVLWGNLGCLHDISSGVSNSFVGEGDMLPSSCAMASKEHISTFLFMRTFFLQQRM